MTSRQYVAVADCLKLDAEGVPLHHVKPHGVLYGMIYRDKELCRAVYEAIPKGNLSRETGLQGLRV